MANTRSFYRLCWTAALFFTSFVSFSTAAATPASASFVLGQGPGNTTLALNVPQNSTDNLFFHFNGPSSGQYLAFGFGGSMSGALMFVVYKSADGTNITVSPRLGTGHVQPLYTKDVTVSLFEGSGIASGMFTVNAMCTGCRSWGDGLGIDATNTNQPMLLAYGSTKSLQSDDLDATIVQHQSYQQFYMDLAQASGIGGVPVLNSGNNTDGSDGGSDGGFQSGGLIVSPGVAAHGLLMIVSFLIIFPGGYLFLKLFEKWWLHAGIQTIGTFFVVLASMIGIVVSKKDLLYPKIDQPHQIIGIVILLLVVATWTLGLIGHMLFRKTGQPAKLMLGHRIAGPLTTTLGLVNVCLGFNLAGHNKPIIGFVVLTLLMIIIVTSLILLKRKRKMRQGVMSTPAAMNFREGQRDEFGVEHGRVENVDVALPKYESSAHSGGNGGNGPAIPLQSYQPNGPPQYR